MDTTRKFTHASYEEAQAALKQNKRNRVSTLVTWDAGNGWTGRGYWHEQFGRILISAEQDGFVII